MKATNETNEVGKKRCQIPCAVDSLENALFVHSKYSLKKSMHPYGHIQEKSDIRCSSFGCNAISLFTCLNLCCPSYYWFKWNTNIIQNMISNFPAVFTIFCGEATDCSYNQSDYGSSTQSPTATPMRAVPITYFLLMNSLLMDCSCVR